MSTEPRYRALERHLRNVIAGAEVGDLLPTVADLCESFGVNGVQTIRNAYEPLVEEGLVVVQMRPRRRWTVARVDSVPEQTAGRDVLEALAELEEEAREHLGRIVALRERLAA